MKKAVAFLLILSICVGFSASRAFGKDGQNSDHTEVEVPHAMESEQNRNTPVVPPQGIDVQLKNREKELQKREASVNNIASNSAEALRNFQTKSAEAKKQRLDCLKEKAPEIKKLEMEKATGSASLSSCSAKNIQNTLPRPTRPSLDGLSSEAKQAAIVAFQASLKEWYTQLQTAMKTCRASVQEARLSIREQIIGIKEQCSNTERSVLGLSTEVPYNAQ